MVRGRKMRNGVAMSSRQGVAMSSKEHGETKASIFGHCVFFALFEGVRGLDCDIDINDYGQMLKHIKRALHARAAKLEEVRCNGALLSPHEVADVHAAVQNTCVADGYFCSFSDPLLVALCAVFRVNVFHDFAGAGTTYEVDGARRDVYLHSTAAHMSHVSNRCLPASAVPTRPAIEAARDEALFVQGTVVSVERRRKGRLLLEVAHANGTVTLVASGDFCQDQQVRIALEGAMYKGRRVDRKKVNGEWSEAVLVSDSDGDA
jgi:hypothetical protein